jgi:hypothetical protein
MTNVGGGQEKWLTWTYDKWVRGRKKKLDFGPGNMVWSAGEMGIRCPLLVAARHLTPDGRVVGAGETFRSEGCRNGSCQFRRN